jgi:hypothetical protein
MLISIDDHEAELLTLALRYWRSQRRGGTMRRGDPLVGPDDIDLLLAKLGVRTLPQRPDDPFDELLLR